MTAVYIEQFVVAVIGSNALAQPMIDTSLAFIPRASAVTTKADVIRNGILAGMCQFGTDQPNSHHWLMAIGWADGQGLDFDIFSYTHDDSDHASLKVNDPDDPQARKYVDAWRYPRYGCGEVPGSFGAETLQLIADENKYLLDGRLHRNDYRFAVRTRVLVVVGDRTDVSDDLVVMSQESLASGDFDGIDLLLVGEPDPRPTETFKALVGNGHIYSANNARTVMRAVDASARSIIDEPGIAREPVFVP